MPISHTHRCIFIHIPKCAGTSVETALGMHRDWRVEDAEAMYGRVSSREWLAMNWSSNFLQHLTWDELTQAVAPSRRVGYRSFAFVRHPLRRMVSVWANLDGDLLEYARARNVQLEGVGFEEFVTRAVPLNHPHLRPQSEFIVRGDGSVAVDEVGRFEHLSEDFLRICGTLGIAAKLPHRNPANRFLGEEAITLRARELVAARYVSDFAAFGYEP